MPGHAPAERSERSPRRPGLGQHFLGSGLAGLVVADAGIACGDRVVDLGAGRGVLTAALAQLGASVVAVEVDPALAGGLAGRFADDARVTVLRADARSVALPLNPFRVVANPPFGATAAILHHLLDDPGGGLVRADVVVQWQVARARARADAGPPLDLLGATWAPWWRFRRGRRIPAAGFRPAPSVDAAVLTITRRDPPLLPADDFAAYERFVREGFTGEAATRRHVEHWVRRFARARAPRPRGERHTRP